MRKSSIWNRRYLINHKTLSLSKTNYIWGKRKCKSNSHWHHQSNNQRTHVDINRSIVKLKLTSIPDMMAPSKNSYWHHQSINRKTHIDINPRYGGTLQKRFSAGDAPDVQDYCIRWLSNVTKNTKEEKSKARPKKIILNNQKRSWCKRKQIHVIVTITDFRLIGSVSIVCKITFCKTLCKPCAGILRTIPQPD